jgi:PAS domain S-box-containing protein
MEPAPQIDERERAEEAGGASCRDTDSRPPASAGTSPSELFEIYSALLDATTDAVMMIDERGSILSFNPSAQRMFGYGWGEVVGRNVSTLMPEPYASEHDSYLDRYLRTGTGRIVGTGSREVFGKSKDGSVFPADLSVSALSVGGRRLFLGILRDATARKLAEAERMQRDKLNSLGQLAGSVAHDFNTVLSSILGYGELLLERLTDPAERQAVEAICTSAERGAALTHRLLAFSRRDPGASEAIDLNSLLQGVELMLSRLIPVNVDLNVELAAEPAAVEADRSLLQQALVNLVLNAVDAVQGHGSIRIALELGPDDIGLRVEDDGVGMSAEIKERIFDPLFTTKPAGRGTGLGLAVVHAAVQQCRGAIRVDSEPGAGTTFHLRLPRCSHGGGAASDSEESPSRALPRGDESILVVEDDPTFRGLLLEVLEGAGYRVTEAADAQAAQAALAQARDPIRLVLTDVQLPGLDGVGLVRRLAREHPELRFVLMSGFGDHVVEGRRDTGQRFLSKPVSNAALLRTVREVLDARSAGET